MNSGQDLTPKFDLANPPDFVRFPGKALLLWEGRSRIKYHTYPAIIREANRQKIILDSRSNGPAIVAFLWAGGERPQRDWNHHGWPIHHIYSGKFPFKNLSATLHAVRDGLHFTQSARLVAVHPSAHEFCGEVEQFAWILREHAFHKFGYDPDGAFSSVQDRFGFVPGRPCEVICPD